MNASIKNIDAGQDPPHFLNVFSGLKGSVASISGDIFKDTLAGPYRWIDHEFIFLINATGEVIPLGFMPQFSALRNMPGEMAIGGIGVIPVPRPAREPASSWPSGFR